MSIEPASAIEAMSIEPVTAAVFDRWIVGVVGGITAFYGALHARWSFDFKALQPGTTRRPRVSLSTKGVRGTSFFIPFQHLGSLSFPTRRFDLLLPDSRSGLSKALSTPILSLCYLIR